MRKRKYTDAQLQVAIISSTTWANVLRLIGVSVSGGQLEHVKSIAKRLKYDYSHFLGRAWNTGNTWKDKCKRIPLAEILVENSTYSSNHLRKRLIAEGLKEAICEKCNLSEWLGLPIALELDHINGIHNDHRFENLRILCPNCHAQTETWRGRNNKAAKQ